MLEIILRNQIIYVSVSNDNIHIHDSHWITSIKDMKYILNEIRKQLQHRPDNIIFKRSLFSMINEWRSHNLLYYFDIQKERTESVDLNEHNLLYDIGYFCLSLFYLRY